MYTDHMYCDLYADLIMLKSDINLVFAGANGSNGTNGLKLEVNEVITLKVGNGISCTGATELGDDTNILIEEDLNLGNEATGNGTSSHLFSEKSSVSGSTSDENEIQEYEQLKPKESNNIIVEYDVKKVLKEQETHDLYCPNCHSCITKRVILRKRKRSQSPSSLPPQKVPHVRAAPAPAEPTEPTEHEDKTAFRCLSCFSLFIPTGIFVLIYLTSLMRSIFFCCPHHFSPFLAVFLGGGGIFVTLLFIVSFFPLI